MYDKPAFATTVYTNIESILFQIIQSIGFNKQKPT